MTILKNKKGIIAIILAIATLISCGAILLNGVLAAPNYAQTTFDNPYIGQTTRIYDMAERTRTRNVFGAVSWSSSDNSVATVTENTPNITTVTYIKAGMVTVTAGSFGGNLTAQLWQITDKNNAISYGTPDKNSMTVVKNTQNIEVDIDVRTGANPYTPGSGNSLVKWVSTNENAITVNANGTINAKNVTDFAMLIGTVTDIYGTQRTISLLVNVGDAPAPPQTITGVTVSPANVTLAVSGSRTFTAVVSGTGNPPQNVVWTVTGQTSANTTINAATGALVVGADEKSTSLTVTATCSSDASKKGMATVTVLVPKVNSVTVSPASVTVQKGKTQQFTANVSTENGASNGVTWSVNSSISTIDASGMLNVPTTETATNLVVTATSIFDGNATGTATVNVTAPAPEVITEVAKDFVMDNEAWRAIAKKGDYYLVVKKLVLPGQTKFHTASNAYSKSLVESKVNTWFRATAADSEIRQ